jgi:hypothetical protein
MRKGREEPFGLPQSANRFEIERGRMIYGYIEPSNCAWQSRPFLCFFIRRALYIMISENINDVPSRIKSKRPFISDGLFYSFFS